jgi:protein SCO1/2
VNIIQIPWTNLLKITFSIIILASGACQQKETLPILGRRTLSQQGDTVYHTVGNYSLINQDSLEITPSAFDDKVYVADFFFTSCPTICPTMKTQMLRVYDKFLEEDNFAILSHTIDPKHDTVAVLREYSERLGVYNSNKWHFVTGDQSEIYRLGQSDYMVTTGADKDAPGGFIHSGAFLLVDDQKRIRGVYDGTVAEDVDNLMNDIEVLLAEVD